RTKCGSSDSMSIRVSFTSKTRTDGLSSIPVATFLKDPGVAVRIAEVGEAGVIGPAWIHAGAEMATPLATVDVLVPDGGYADAAVDEFVAHRRDVVDHEVQALRRTRARVGEPDAELYRGARPRRRELHDAKVRCRCVV